MSTNIDRAADVIEPLIKTTARMSLHAESYRQRAGRIACKLHIAGLLAPELPVPALIGRRGALGGLRAEWGLGFDTVVADGSHVWAGRYLNPLTPEDTRRLAYALLAAAEHAEEVGTDGQDN